MCEPVVDKLNVHHGPCSAMSRESFRDDSKYRFIGSVFVLTDCVINARRTRISGLTNPPPDNSGTQPGYSFQSRLLAGLHTDSDPSAGWFGTCRGVSDAVGSCSLSLLVLSLLSAGYVVVAYHRFDRVRVTRYERVT